MKKFIVKRVFFPILNLKNQFNVNFNNLNQSQWLPLKEIQIIQWRKLKSILNYSYYNIPYYQNLFKRGNLNPLDIKSFYDLSKIPVLSKKIIKNNYNSIINKKIDQKSIIKTTTSGSTGEPVTIFRDVNTDHIHIAAGWRFRRWTGHDIGERYSRIWGRPIENNSLKKINLIQKIKREIDYFIEPVENLDAYTLSENEMDVFFQNIKRKKIKFLVGYANSIYFFSQFVNKYHPSEIRFDSVRTISEMLYDNQRSFIENVFDCRVFDTYGNRENGLIAAECDHHEGYHINSENLYIEILDNNGKPVPLEETGEIAVTDLNNYAMPMIRYLTGDQGCLSSKMCSCGRGLPLIKKIIGRNIDMLIMADGSSFNGSIIFHTISQHFSDLIERFKIIQNKKGELDLYLQLSTPFSKDQFEQFKQILKNKFKNLLIFKYYFVDELPLQKSGKYKYIISNINS